MVMSESTPLTQPTLNLNLTTRIHVHTCLVCVIDFVCAYMYVHVYTVCLTSLLSGTHYHVLVKVLES